MILFEHESDPSELSFAALKDTHAQPPPHGQPGTQFSGWLNRIRRGFPIFSLATLPASALFTAILSRWCMGHHVAAADKRRIALLSNYGANPASIKAVPSGRTASAAFRSTNEEHFSREDLKSLCRALR